MLTRGRQSCYPPHRDVIFVYYRLVLMWVYDFLPWWLQVLILAGGVWLLLLLSRLLLQDRPRWASVIHHQGESWVRRWRHRGDYSMLLGLTVRRVSPGMTPHGAIGATPGAVSWWSAALGTAWVMAIWHLTIVDIVAFRVALSSTVGFLVTGERNFNQRIQWINCLGCFIPGCFELYCGISGYWRKRFQSKYSMNAKI